MRKQQQQQQQQRIKTAEEIEMLDEAHNMIAIVIAFVRRTFSHKNMKKLMKFCIAIY